MKAVAGGHEVGPGDFGRLVKRYREARGMSQDRLAELVGITGGYVSQIESGTRGRRPARDLVISFAQALQANPAEFLRATGRLEPGDDMSPEARMGFEEFVNSDPALRADQKRALVTLYRTWVREARPTG